MPQNDDKILVMPEWTRENIIEGLKAGRTLVIDRRDSPALPICLALEREGLVTTEFVEFDEQSSALKVRRKK